MKRIAVLLLLTLTLPTLCLAETQAQPTTVTSTDLIENAIVLDAKTVSYTGEVIGDIMRRGSYTWLNIFDGSNAIGVWVETAMLGDIDTAGRYGMHGDEVTVTGTFHRACREHGGDMDIHADTVTLVAGGYAIPHPLQGGRVIVMAILSLCVVGVLIRIIVTRRRYQIL